MPKESSLKDIIHIGMTHSDQRAGGLNTYVKNLVSFKSDCSKFKHLAFVSASKKYESEKIKCLSENSILKLYDFYKIIKNQSSEKIIASHFAYHSVFSHFLFKKNLWINFFHGPWCEESLYEGDHFLNFYLKKSVEKLVYQKSDFFIVLSKAFKKVLSEEYSIPNHKIHVIDPMIDLNDYCPLNIDRLTLKKELNLPLNKSIFFCLRRLQNRMGLKELILNLEQLQLKKIPFYCVISGKGVLEEELNKMIVQKKLSDSVRITGGISHAQKKKFYWTADYNLVPSLSWEGFGLTVAEAYASGIPSITSSFGGLPEAVGTFKSTLCYQNTDRHFLELLINCIKNPLLKPSQSDCLNEAKRFSPDVFDHNLNTALYHYLVD